MAQTINTNIASLTAQRNLSVSQKEANQAMERLSSGLRINSAKDDAAGLAISNRLTAQINGINQAVRNANDGLSVSQVAEGALAETSTLLQRMRELAVQSANASNSSADRTALQTEVTQLIAEMDRIATNTKFGTTALLDGTYTSQAFQVGANASETMSVSVASAKSTALGSTTTTSTGINFANFKSANATSSVASASNSSGVTAQTLSLVVNGTQTNVAVAADATAATIATSFNAAQTDVVASASTGARLNAATGVEASDTINLVINGVTLSALATDTAATASASIAAAVTADSTLSATLTATDNGNGTVDLRDSTGGDITVVWNNTGTDGSSNNTFTVQELNTAGSVVGVAESITSTQGTTVTGDITFTVSDATKSYELFSSDGSGALTSATSAFDGKGAAENITFSNFNTADAGASAATAVDLLASAQTLTFTTDGVQDSIAIAATDTAATIATSITNNISGFTAKAVTGARVSLSSTAGATLDLQINGVSLTQQTGTPTNAAAATAAVSAINSNVALSKTLTAVDNGDGSFDIFDATGDSIVIDDITGASRTFTVQALDAAGALSGSAQTIATTQGTIVMGDILMSVDDTTKTYSVHSSVGTGITSATAAGNGAGTISSTSSTSSAISATDISTVAGATSALTSIDAALTSLDSERASLGAVQNRFDSVISNLSNVSENTSAARSRIMDADFAAETAQLAKTQILQQAGISVLAQANAQPQNILALLQ